MLLVLGFPELANSFHTFLTRPLFSIGTKLDSLLTLGFFLNLIVFVIEYVISSFYSCVPISMKVFEEFFLPPPVSILTSICCLFSPPPPC